MNTDSLVLFVQSETAYMYEVCDLTAIRVLANAFFVSPHSPTVSHALHY